MLLVRTVRVSGLTADGPTEVETRAVWVKREMLERARRTRLLVDATKFGSRHLEIVCPLERLGGLVTDRAPTGALAAAIKRARLELQVAATGDRPADQNLLDSPQKNV